MNARTGFGLLVGAAMLSVVALAAQDASPAKIAVTESASQYVVTVPASRLNLALPKADLIPGRPAPGAEPNYFIFDGKTTALSVSGWFSPAGGFGGIKEFWAAEAAHMKQAGLPEPRNVTFEQFATWTALFYDITVPMPGATSAHVRAHWVEAGTWIDVHLSLTGPASERPRDEVKALLKTLVVSIKK